MSFNNIKSITLKILKSQLYNRSLTCVVRCPWFLNRTPYILDESKYIYTSCMYSFRKDVFRVCTLGGKMILNNMQSSQWPIERHRLYISLYTRGTICTISNYRKLNNINIYIRQRVFISFDRQNRLILPTTTCCFTRPLVNMPYAHTYRAGGVQQWCATWQNDATYENVFLILTTENRL